MKRLFLSILVALLSMNLFAQTNCWDGTVSENYNGGNGTIEDPYQIANAQQLALLAQQTNSGTGGDAYYILVDDIWLNDGITTNTWTAIGLPIESEAHYFTGRFDGNGKTIHGLLNEDYDRITGLFGCTDGAEITNVHLSDVKLKGSQYVGGLVAYAGGTDVSNCSIENANLFSLPEAYETRVGGLIGYLGAPYPYATNVVNYTGTNRIADCQTASDVEVRGLYAGGVVGYFSFANMVNCKNYGSVKSDRIAGGVIGVVFSYQVQGEETWFITGCHNYGEITIESDEEHGAGGGLIGCFLTASHHVFYVVDCSNHGDVHCNGQVAGGIIGSAVPFMNILNVYNTGNINALGMAGGIVGRCLVFEAFICRNAYNTGEIMCENSELLGAILGEGYVIISDCYWLANENYGGSGGSLGLTNSCAFGPTDSPTEWQLDSLCYNTHDLLTALNAGAESIENDYPEVGEVSRWCADMTLTNGGTPVFEPYYNLYGGEWYYEITNANGSITYQYLQCAGDTAVAEERPKIIVRTNTIYDDKGKQQTVTHEYVYERDSVVYWWNKDLQEFTTLYDLTADVGDEWVINVGTESLVMHVDAVSDYEYDGRTLKMLSVSDENDLFSGDIVCGIGHLTSFFPERLMNRGRGYRVKGIRCYWQDGELVFKLGEKDCDEVYQEYHNQGVDETETSGFRIYPNPANDVIVVETPEGATLQEYRITNLLGKTMLTGTSQTINVSSLPSGMYFLTLGTQTLKFTKQ